MVMIVRVVAVWGHLTADSGHTHLSKLSLLSLLHIAVQYSTVQYSTVQYSTVQYSVGTPDS